MRELPILFTGEMVRAILADRKTQTRRIVKLNGRYGKGENRFVFSDADGDKHLVDCPYGQPGDQLYVRETWQHSNHPFGPLEKNCVIFYRADYFDDPHGMDGEKSPEGKYRDWRPSIHMPRWASRITLEVTGVRVERLNEISEADAIAEGVEPEYREGELYATAVDVYSSLWEKINGAGSWDANPWVWVIQFKKYQQYQAERL